jgi:predicted amidohydrolase YtcJ
MLPRPHLALAALGISLVAGCSWLGGAPAADWVLRGGVVHTQDPARPRATAIALRAGRVLAVGDDAAVSALVGPRTAVVELAGRAVVPGFHDAHVHPLAGGVELNDCYLGDIDDPAAGYRAAVVSKVRTYAARHPGKAWIRGSGWALPWFAGGSPHKAWLDAAERRRPVVLWAADGHSLWASSKALALAGVTRATKDPAHGRIERDARGEPTGTLREAAMDLVARHVPPYPPAEREAGLARGLELARAVGLTTLFEADADEDTLRAYAALERRGELTARVVAALHAEPAEGAAQVARLAAWRTRYASARLRPIAAKLFVDGVIEAKTAALVQPYVGGARPAPAIAPATLAALVTALDRAGFQAHMHAIGDGAVRASLDAVAAARAANGPRDARHTIAHLELVDPADLPRFARLGVVAAFQPYWAQRDPYVRDLTEPVIGPARSARLYPIGALRRAGAAIAFGSDWSVSSLDPLDGMQVAVTRRDPTEGPGPAWLPGEAVTAAEALAAYTRGAAYAAFQEREAGTLAPGFAADLVVLSADPLALPPARIAEAEVQLTMLGGVPIHRTRAIGWGALDPL